MPAKDLGIKHSCFKCGTKFYDFRKPAPVCPKCGTDQRESPALKAAPVERRAKVPPRPAEPEMEEPAEEAEEAFEELDADEAADDDKP